VYRLDDLLRTLPNGWRVREGAEPLYEQPLGSESAVREYWSEPAALLGLPLLAAVYDQGFYHGIFWSGEQLGSVVTEVDRLEAHWSAARLPSDLLADLQERARYVREAVAVASAVGGWLVI
jgi:hypothetical protein